MEKLAYSKELSSLKQQTALAQKDIRRMLYSTHNRGEYTELESTERGLENAFNSWHHSLFRSLKRVANHVKDLTVGVRGVVDRTRTIDPNYDEKLVTLQRATEGVETELREFKGTCRKEFELLTVDETTLTTELAMLLDKFESWEKAPEVRAKTASYYPKGKESDPHKQEVLRLDREIQELGGGSLGWDEVEHKEFLKLRTKYNQKLCPAFFRDAASLLPMYDQEAIEDHCDKHDIIQRLQLKKRNLLAAWREAKLKNAVESVENDVEEQQPKKPLKRPESAEATKQKLEEWRKAQAEAKSKQEEAKKSSEKKKREEVTLRQLELDRKKQLVAEFKERKEFEKFHKELVDNYTKRRSTTELTDDDKERLRQREEKLVEKRRLAAEAKAQAEQLKRAKAAESRLKSEANWAYVDSRLQQETTAFIKRKEDKKRENRADSFGGQLIRTTGRAVPSWRIGVSR